jgi:CRP-like cAMP-binding protein
MREATIIAVTSSRLLALSANEFEGLFRKRPGLKEQLFALAAEQSQGSVGPLSSADLKEAHQVPGNPPR